jgi:hypothetical protein
MFSRTPSGIRNTDLFYKGQYLIIIEGEDDEPFWGVFFPEEVDGYKRKFKPVGGAAVNKYIEEISHRNANFGVAIDSDYRLLLGKVHHHPRILETHCHSIENLMLSSSNIVSIIRTKSRVTDYDIQDVETWLDHFNESLYKLMVADFLNEQNNLGIKCAGDNCFRFLEKTHVPKFDETKINSFINSLNFPQEQLDKASQRLKGYKPSLHIRGHFFSSAVLCFINHEVKKVRRIKKKNICISNDDFYTMLVLCCEVSLSSSPLMQSFRDRAVNVAKEVVKIL